MTDSLPFRITITNKPLQSGGTMDVEYDFAGLSDSSVELKIEWTDTEGEPTTIYKTVTNPPGETSVSIPDTARGVKIVDQSGQSQAASAAISA